MLQISMKRRPIFSDTGRYRDSDGLHDLTVVGFCDFPFLFSSSFRNPSHSLSKACKRIQKHLQGNHEEANVKKTSRKTSCITFIILSGFFESLSNLLFPINFTKILLIAFPFTQLPTYFLSFNDKVELM